MKKRMIALFAGICTAALVTGCGSSVSNDKIKIAKYKGLEVQKVDKIKVTDEHVEQSLQSTLEAQGVEEEVTGRPAQQGDIATIDYEGKKDGEVFDGGTATDYPLTLGSGQFIDGFEDGIVGHNVGDTFDLELTFPEDYPSDDLAGADVVFTVTVKKLSQLSVPELTDELVKELSETAKTVEEYKKEVKKDLQKSNDESTRSRLEQNIWEELVKNCTVSEYPEDKKKEKTDTIKAQYSSVASMYGMEDVDEFVKQMMGISIDEMAEKTITQEYAIELIAEKENIKISDDDYKKGLKKYAEQFGYEDGKQLEEVVGKDELKKAMVQDKVTELLVENCKQVEKKEEQK